MKTGARNRNLLLILGVCIAILVILYLVTPSFDPAALSNVNYRSLADTLHSNLTDIILSDFPF